MTVGARAGVGLFFSGQDAHQRRLAGAVVADERNAIAALDVQVDVVQHDFFLREPAAEGYALRTPFSSCTMRPLFGAAGNWK